jgi:phosphoribosyl 1,2-cyclic phosphodiesterase
MPGPDKLRYGGNTPCVEVAVGGSTIILDAGTGIIPLGHDLIRRAGVTAPIQAVILLSHLHHDHTDGLLGFLPATRPDTRLFLGGPGTKTQALATIMRGRLRPPFWPAVLQAQSSQLHVHTIVPQECLHITPGTAEVCSVTGRTAPAADTIVVAALRSITHPGGTLIYRIAYRGRSVVYATDVEGQVGGTQALIQFAQGADVLIHAAQYTDDHYYRSPGCRHGARGTPGLATGGRRCVVAGCPPAR